MDLEKYKGILNDYRLNCEYLKQICSDKANKYYRYNNYLTRITLIASIILSAIAFVNKDTVIEYFFIAGEHSDNECITTQYTFIYDFIYNSIVVLVLVLSVINLICRFQERSTEYFHTVTTLSSIIREIDKLSLIEADTSKFILEFENIQLKYNTILDYLPPHTDNDFIKAKYKLKVKKEMSELIKNKSVWKLKIWFTRICLRIFLEEKTK